MDIKKRINKKGIFMTTIVLFIITLFVISYTIVNISQSREAIQKRITTMNTFLVSTESDISRQLYIFGYRMILIWEDEIITGTSQYITEQRITNTLNESFFNGTYDGKSHQFLELNFSSLNESINKKGNKVNVKITMNNPKITISQDNPWYVKFTLTTNFTMEDLGGLAVWNKTSEISGYVPIENFEDPVYSLNRMVNKMVQTPYIFSESDLTNLSLHAENSYYISNPLAPSFLDRLKGNLSAKSPYGIESIVNAEIATAKTGETLNKSLIDYIYFNSTANPLPTYTASGLPSWFKIDNSSSRLSLYNISSATIV